MLKYYQNPLLLDANLSYITMPSSLDRILLGEFRPTNIQEVDIRLMSAAH